MIHIPVSSTRFYATRLGLVVIKAAVRAGHRGATSRSLGQPCAAAGSSKRSGSRDSSQH